MFEIISSYFVLEQTSVTFITDLFVAIVLGFIIGAERESGVRMPVLVLIHL